MLDTLEKIRTQGLLSELDLQFCRFIDDLEQGARAELLVGAALSIQATREGNVCLSLNDLAGTFRFRDEGIGGEGLVLPLLTDWVEALRNSAVVGMPGEYKPLILDGDNRLYLYRYWEYEQRLAGNIAKRVHLPVTMNRTKPIIEGMNRLFPQSSSNEPDWQKIAVAGALLKKFCVISGGPGTGKTFTVVKLLALLQEMAAPDFLNIGLAAPTGKAAGRLSESIKGAKQHLDSKPEIVEHIPENAKTIHRLLGVKKGSPYFRHDQNNPLPLDVLIIDEASMADLALMCKLFDAFSDDCRLILLGDKDQLASVEAGKVLGDICGEVTYNRFSRQFANELFKICPDKLPDGSINQETTALEDGIVLLEKSFRFDPASGIGSLAQAVTKGRPEQVVSCFIDRKRDDIHWHARYDAESSARLADCVKQGFQSYLQADTPVEAFFEFNRFRLLCVYRHGSRGLVSMNNWTEGLLEQAGFIKKTGIWYEGRPIMILKNDYSLHLYNGDIGITWHDADGHLRVYFIMADGAVRSFSPLRIPEHETTFAMTVHKSQGSEFDHVALLLPEKPSPVVTRELLYTAVSRARSRFELWGDPQVLNFAITHQTKRNTGLREILWSCAEAYPSMQHKQP